MSPARAEPRSRQGRERALRGSEWRTLALLGIPSLVLALAVTVVTTYLPVRLQTGRASTTTIGLLIGAEGLVALCVPLVVGPWSDRVRLFGGRLPFVACALPPLVACLVLLGLVSGIGVAALVLVLFFGAYYLAYEPYRAMYPDLVDDEIAGRAQSTQALFRGGGTFLALVGGGLLLSVGAAVPFAVAAVLVAVGAGGFLVVVARRRPGRGERPRGHGAVAQARRLWAMLRDRPELRTYLAANALWELALSALKTFVVLYLTIGLGYALGTSSLIIGGVALLLLVASPLSGKLGDRYGRARVMEWSVLVYGLGMLVPFLVTWKPAVALAVPVIALGGGVVMTLPYAILMGLMSDDEHGALTGFYSLSRGIGTALGPLLAGVAISATSGALAGTKGYQATWGVCAAALLASVALVRRLRWE